MNLFSCLYFAMSFDLLFRSLHCSGKVNIVILSSRKAVFWDAVFLMFHVYFLACVGLCFWSFICVLRVLLLFVYFFFVVKRRTRDLLDIWHWLIGSYYLLSIWNLFCTKFIQNIHASSVVVIFHFFLIRI